MTVFALWSAPRARSTAFFRSILERGDLLALHEPLEGVTYLGPAEIQGRRFESAEALLQWLREETQDLKVFFKETTDPRVLELVLSDREFLANVRHAFLIRRPEEIAASLYAMIEDIRSGGENYPDMRVDTIGLAALHELYSAVSEVGRHPNVVIDSDDLISRPAATMAAYCDAMGLPFIPEALTWEPGERPEWSRSARWHVDASASSRFEQPSRQYAHTTETSETLAAFAKYHLPYYEKLYAQRLDVGRFDLAL